MQFPLSDTLKYSTASPVVEKLDVWKQEFTVPLPAPRYWQSRHQHTRVTIGDSELSQRTKPQRQLPEIVIVSSLGGVKQNDRRSRGGSKLPHS